MRQLFSYQRNVGFCFPPQQGLFQDEGKLAFYFPSQVSMETACNHDTCKQQLPIQLHTIFSYFEHFCHNFDIPEMSNNCFLTFLLPAHTVIWGSFCSRNLQWCSSTVICVCLCVYCVCMCRHTHMHIIYLWWTSSGTSQYKSLFYNLRANAVQANFHFRDFSCADNFKFQSKFFFNCSQEGGCGRNEYFVFTEKILKAVSLEDTGTFIL